MLLLVAHKQIFFATIEIAMHCCSPSERHCPPDSLVPLKEPLGLEPADPAQQLLRALGN